MKFTEQGSTTLAVRFLDNAFELSVANTRIGITPEDLPHIFDNLRQVESGARKTQEGTGLDLSIAKKSIKVLGLTISVENEMGKGTKFTLRLTDHEDEKTHSVALL